MSSSRTLTLKQLKDVIEDMYNQKQKYDDKCAENKLPRETMEQYMYTYLNQRYGLKNLIIDWAAAIINGLKRYSKEDCDVSLFSKIMRNECDEDFRYIHSEVKSAIIEILRDKLKKKYKRKTDGEINAIINSIQSKDIEESLCHEIINVMYNEEHANTLIQRIREHIENYNSQFYPPNKRKLTREEQVYLQRQKERALPYIEFQKVFLI